MQYPVTNDTGNLYPTPPPTPGFPVATNYGDYIYYNGTDWTVGDTKIKLGGFAGQTNQGIDATALGYFAGNSNQGTNSVAIGHNCANTSQGSYAVAMGANAAYSNQGTEAVAIGSSAGNTRQGNNCIAIGAYAGVLDQPANTIMLNATGNTYLGVSGQTGCFYAAPVRDFGTANTFSPLAYDPATKEIGYSAPRCGIHQCTASTTQVITITGLTSAGVVGLTYVHPNGGGASQYFVSSTPTTNTLTVVLANVGATGETIIWIVGKL